jgi:DNA-binding winged helix-turn-helix (wHTH) protein
MRELIKLHLNKGHLEIVRNGVVMILPIEAVKLISDMLEASGITNEEIKKAVWKETEYDIGFALARADIDSQVRWFSKKIVITPTK